MAIGYVPKQVPDNLKNPITISIKDSDRVTLTPINIDPAVSLTAEDQLKAMAQMLIMPWFNNATTNYDPADLMMLMQMALSGTQAKETLNSFNTLFKAVLENYVASETHMPAELLIDQAAARYSLPAPVPGEIIYTIAEDIIPYACALVANKCTMDEFMPHLMRALNMPITIVACRDASVFDQYKAELTKVARDAKTAGADANNLKKAAALVTRELDDMMLPLKIRDEYSDALEPYSFARMALYAARKMDDNKNLSVFDYDVDQVLTPKTLVFINVYDLSKANKSTIKKRFSELKTALKNRLDVLSDEDITELGAVERESRQASNEKYDLDQSKRERDTKRAEREPFGDIAPNPAIQIRRIDAALRRMNAPRRSLNTKSRDFKTMTRSNRRAPDNPDKAGRSTINRYIPDIHIYVDSSGSISKEQYAASVIAVARLAKKLDVNLYISLFSDSLTRPYKIMTKGKSLKNIVFQIHHLPSITGGTDFSLVWDYIDQHPRAAKELAIMITDFEYTYYGSRPAIPANLLYMPINNSYWGNIKTAARDFAQSMMAVDPLIMRRLMM